MKETYYVAWTTVFDITPYYLPEPIKSVLREAGAENIHMSNAYGWSNQPEVVCFDYQKNEKELITLEEKLGKQLTEETGVIFSPLSIRVKDWETVKEKLKKRWLVDVAYSGYISVEVEAYTEEEALSRAEDKAGSSKERPDNLSRWPEADMIEEVIEDAG